MLEATNGSAILTDDSLKQYEKSMLTMFPEHGVTLTVSLSAYALAKVLVGIKNYDW